MGKPLSALMQDYVFGPAGMTDCRFRLNRAEAARLTVNYGVIKGRPLPLDRPSSSVFLDAPPFEFGGAGLVTTARDYDRFMQVLLGEGKIAGRQVLNGAAVRLAMSNLLPAGADTAGTPAAGAGFGAGGRVGLGVDEGSFGWSGAAGTIFLVQRRIGLRAGLYAQFMPPGVYPLQKEFLSTVREDITVGGTL
jgi:CubicO group peptidase (beta-lactamase class C family)